MRHLWFVAIFSVVPMIMPPPVIAEEPLEERHLETDIDRRMRELYLTVPLGIEIGCKEKGWVAWKFIEYHLKKENDLEAEGVPIAYVLQYISKEDFEKWQKKEFIFNMELKAELVFCHKHKRASHFRYFIDGREQVIHLHEKTGGA